MRMRKSLASVDNFFYIERYGEIRIFATKIAILVKLHGQLAGWLTIMENIVILNILSFKWSFSYCLVAAKTKK